MLWLMHYSIRDFMHNLAVTVVVSEIFYTQADLCIIILCIMRMSTVLLTWRSAWGHFRVGSSSKVRVLRCKALLVEFCSARHLQGTCKAVCKAVLVVKSCANISSCFLAISLSSHWLPLAQPLLTARHLQGILHGTYAWQNLEAGCSLGPGCAK